LHCDFSCTLADQPSVFDAKNKESAHPLLFSLFVSAETIVDYKLEVPLVSSVLEKNTVAAYNPRSYTSANRRRLCHVLLRPTETAAYCMETDIELFPVAYCMKTAAFRLPIA